MKAGSAVGGGSIGDEGPRRGVISAARGRSTDTGSNRPASFPAAGESGSERRRCNWASEGATGRFVSEMRQYSQSFCSSGAGVPLMN